MALALVEVLKNLKIKNKIILIFCVILILLADLGVLTISSVRDIQKDTQRISDNLVPQLLHTTAIKDNLNMAILAAYDYVQTDKTDSKSDYAQHIKQALLAEIALFERATSQEDFEFTTSFQKHINNINDALTDLVQTYEQGDRQLVPKKLAVVSKNRDAFAAFLEQEIEQKVQAKTVEEREQTQSRVRRTTMNVAVVGIITVIAFILVYLFVYRALTKPVQSLTVAAEKIGQGEFTTVQINNRDELGLFAQTFNSMSGKIQSTQEALKIELAKTKKLDHQKTEFLSIAAHQLRTPMSGIKWALGMILEGDFGRLSTGVKAQLTKTLTNTQRMLALINNLLDVTTFDDEKLQYHFVPTDVISITKENCQDLQNIANQAKVILECQLPAKRLPAVNVDKAKIAIAIRNIIDNAIKYTPAQGTVSVDFERRKEEILINIRDTGYGIPPEEYDRLFTKFYRGSNIQTVQTEGSGLGLFVANQIVKKHSGTITFTTKSGIGSTFTIHLPLAGVVVLSTDIPTALTNEAKAA